MKKLILLLLSGILSITAIAQNPLSTYKTPLTASSMDSLIYLTPEGAVKALRAHSGLFYSNQIRAQQDTIIMQLNRAILIKEIRLSELNALSANQANTIKIQKKKLFWKGVEIWGYRISTAGGIYLLLFR